MVRVTPTLGQVVVEDAVGAALTAAAVAVIETGARMARPLGQGIGRGLCRGTAWASRGMGLALGQKLAPETSSDGA